jgi:hypothetical protein
MLHNKAGLSVNIGYSYPSTDEVVALPKTDIICCGNTVFGLADHEQILIS